MAVFLAGPSLSAVFCIMKDALVIILITNSQNIHTAKGLCQ
jgi:hypothetical protein